MQVAACPRCASLDIRPATFSDGVALGGGETSFAVCHHCSFRGSPLLLDDEAAYTAFRASVRPGEGDASDGGAGGAPANAPEVDEEAPPGLAGLMAIPPPRPPRVSAFLVGALGVLAIGFGVFQAGVTLAGAGEPGANRLPLLLGLFAVAVGIAVVRIAARMARKPSPSMTQAP